MLASRGVLFGLSAIVCLLLGRELLRTDTPVAADDGELTRLRVELREVRDANAAHAIRHDGLTDEIAALKARLGESQRLRAQREEEWFEYTRAIGIVDQKTEDDRPAFLDALDEANAGPPEPELTRAELAAADARERRVKRMRLDLNALLATEHVGGIEMLELGVLGDGYVGPVVVRTLDDRRRPTGTLVSERLRLECSRSGFTVTLVFEEGYERHGAMEVPFGVARVEGERRGGVKRIALSGIDPRPWIEVLPELFDESATVFTPDDGRWDLQRVRLSLNRVLGQLEDVGANLRVRGLGGVQSSVMYDVHLIETDENGAISRRVFADRMSVRTYGKGLELLLEDGVQERGERSAPFLEGRYRIFLPNADVAAWKLARIPGLVPAALRAEQDVQLGG